jgi:hypothetical protein
MKVIIVVSGGTVQNVYADLPNIDVELIDIDDLVEESGPKAADEALEKALKRCPHDSF